MAKGPRRNWTDEEKELLFHILGAIKNQRSDPSYNVKGGNKLWEEDCARTAEALSVILKEEIRATQVMGQTFMFEPPTFENFRKAMKHNYITIDEYFGSYYMKQKK